MPPNSTNTLTHYVGVGYADDKSIIGMDPGFLPGEGAKGLMGLYGMVTSDF